MRGTDAAQIAVFLTLIAIVVVMFKTFPNYGIDGMKKTKAQMMYLVVARTNLDELPILLTNNRNKAFAKAKNVTDAEMDAAVKLMQVDHAGRVCSAVITFKNGNPYRFDICEDLDGDTLIAAEAT